MSERTQERLALEYLDKNDPSTWINPNDKGDF
jgi:hypothetical protein